MILENGDGEELSISAGKKKSLLSHIRLLEINPYNVGKNPYKSLSKGFLLYTSAYPIRYNQERDKLDIAKQAMGINVRIYELSFGAKIVLRLMIELIWIVLMFGEKLNIMSMLEKI